MTGTTSSLHDKYTATTTPRDGMSRTASGSDINERNYSMFFPIERLAKVNLLLHYFSKRMESTEMNRLKIFNELFFYFENV